MIFTELLINERTVSNTTAVSNILDIINDGNEQFNSIPVVIQVINNMIIHHSTVVGVTLVLWCYLFSMFYRHL